MSIIKFIATDKHPTIKEGATIIVLDDGGFKVVDGTIGSEDLLQMWIEQGWCMAVMDEEPKWTDSELKEMCIAYAKHADESPFIHEFSEHFNDWFTDMTNPSTDTREIRS